MFLKIEISKIVKSEMDTATTGQESWNILIFTIVFTSGNF
jgi:hypothetical protein